jgi:hypothetical protein
MEQDYIRDLNTIIQNFMIPLRRAMSDTKPKDIPVIRANEMASIFSNIETIHGVHLKNLSNLEILREKWPFIDGIGNCFLDLGPFLKSYG